MKTEIDYVVKQDCRNGMKVLAKYINSRLQMLEDYPTIDKTKCVAVAHENSFVRYNEIDGKEMLWKDVFHSEHEFFAMEFAEWIRIDFNPSSLDGEWWNRGSNGADTKIYTTKELFEKFKNRKTAVAVTPINTNANGA